MSSDGLERAEAELLAEFVEQRSEAAFAELVRRHLPMVLGVCRRVLDNDAHGAEDAAQAVFLALARKAGSLGRERALGGWLHHVALCAARNERTARARRLRREQEAAAMQDESAPEIAPETAAALREWLDRELDALPAKYRQSLVMVHLEGRSLEETAAALSCKDGTLRVWLNRAREKLRNRLARHGVAVSVPALVAWLASHGEAAAAAVPPDLGAATAKGAMLWISGGTAAAGLAPHVVAAAKGVIQTMFISKLKSAAAVTAVAAIVTTASAMSWQKVYEARDQGLPKTAIEELKPIIVDALANKRHAEVIKAICTKIAMEGNIEGNKPEEKITRLEAEIAGAPAEMKPMMEAILANWYWHYFQQNRWRFLQRTQTSEAPGKDFTTWDLPRILAEIDKHFASALANERELKATPVSQFDDLLEKGSVPDSYRPTLFDFLAHEALQFYQAGEQGAAKAEDEFEIAADSPVFLPVADFLKWQPPAADADAPKLKAVMLYQNLLAFHQADTNRSAFLDADLARIHFANNQAVGPDKAVRYKAALKRFATENSPHELSALALANLASLLNGEDEPAEARNVAAEGMEKFPQSFGGIQCYNLIQQIQSKSADIEVERVWNVPWPVTRVTYRNVPKVFFRAVAYDFEAHLNARRWAGQDNLDDDQQKDLLTRAPARTWSADLPPTADFRQRAEDVPVPQDLKPGYYFIVASYDESFARTNNQLSYAAAWVSDLALVTRQRSPQGALEGFVLSANSGAPLAGAVVRAFERDQNGKYQMPGRSTTTDSNGLFRIPHVGKYSSSCLLLAEHGGQKLGSSQDCTIPSPNPYEPRPAIVFFTDRALYRPGQAIQYKGICYQADTAKNDYKALEGRTLTVVLHDANGKEVAKAQHQCNDYGAFSGSFTVPAGRGTGQMNLHVESGPYGYAYFNVEEYKRPKFQVELVRPKEAARLGAEVVMTGKATAYTGAAIGGAKVQWRVVREVRFPSWCWWGRFCFPPNHSDRQNIAHGTAVTGTDGAFTLKFIASPDLSVPEKTEPTFTFQVYADVTDSTGETRSDSQETRAGYTALQATVGADEWQTPEKPVEWSIATSSLDGEPQAARGTLKIHALKQPDTVVRAELRSDRYDYRWFLRQGDKKSEPKPDPANPESWELAAVVAEQPFQTDATGAAKLTAPLKPGIYRAMLETKDRFGKTVTARHTVQVVDVKAAKYPIKLANYLAAPKWSLAPGESFLALWGTGYDAGRAFVEVEQDGKVLKAWWTAPDRTQEIIEHPVGEEDRGGFTLRVTYIRENRAYLNEHIVDVPWSNKVLSVKWEHFTSRLEPGKKETWTAIITGPDAKRAVAEMVAGLYDASLDQYQPHAWMQRFDVFRREYNQANAGFDNNLRSFQGLYYGWRVDLKPHDWNYRAFPAELTVNLWGYGYVGGRGEGRGLALRKRAAAVPMEAAAFALASDAAAPLAASDRKALSRAEGKGEALQSNKKQADKSGGLGGVEAPSPDLGKIAARRNLNETAFFFPHLLSDTDGAVRMEFTMPEALTEWKFMGFTHDKDLRSGFLTNTAVTAKDLMVEPNPPRFVREGDTIEFTVKVSNQSAARQTGKVRLTFADARTLKDVTATLLSDTRHATPDLSFDIPSKESKSFAWRMTIPDGMDFLTYKAVGATDRLSDGEEGYLPVLSRRVLVTESLPLPIRGAQTRTFDFAKLLESGTSKTLKNENLTVQMVSQPAWYAVMALPYLMETPHEYSEAVFNRLYANALARHIANADPKIRRIFDLWKNTPALDSPLEKNQDLKSVMLEETPWLRQANDESQARRNVGILFDANRLDSEAQQTFRKLAEMQLDDGLWPWFPRSRGDEYMTLYIVAGFGRLRHLGVTDADMSAALKATDALDGWMDKKYREILKNMKNPEEYVPGSIDAFYLYGRSFFLKDKPIAKPHQEAVDFFLQQSKQFWLKVDYRQSQGHLAIALKRFGDADTPVAIMKSLAERSVSSEEMGMYWRDLELSWWWYRAPIETQALMIEAFDEVMGDAKAVEDCKVWLLKQKQTQDWKTTKATADAVYGLLLRGTNLLASDALVEVSLGGKTIKPEQVEAGTGFYEQKFMRGEIKPAMGAISVTKTDAGVSWGSVHWQYLEDMTKVTPYEGTPLKLKKTLYRKTSTRKGQVLEPVKGALAVGDELVCRIELRVDRDMEYVHLKDQRGSGTEPVSVLSENKYRDGLAYYESTRDTASHFFIHYLPKGVYVFEYSVRVQLKGKYQTGIASIQSLYAPEFNSHSESLALDVK